MNKNAVICAIEHALKNEGCNEVGVGEIYERVKKTRGNFDLSFDNFATVVTELVNDGLFELFGNNSNLSASSLMARSQTHPSVSYGKPIQL